MTNIEKLKAMQIKMDSGGGDRVLIIDQYRKALKSSLSSLLDVAEAAQLYRYLKMRDPCGNDYQNNAMLWAATDKLDSALTDLNAVKL